MGGRAPEWVLQCLLLSEILQSYISLPVLLRKTSLCEKGHTKPLPPSLRSPYVYSVHFYVPKKTCHVPCLFPERHGKMNRLLDHSYTPAHPTPAPPGSTTPQSDCCKYCCTVCNQILLSSKALPAAPSPPSSKARESRRGTLWGELQGPSLCETLLYIPVRLHFYLRNDVI